MVGWWLIWLGGIDFSVFCLRGACPCSCGVGLCLLSYWVLPLNSEALAILKAWRRQTKFEFVFTNEVGERLRAVRDWQKTKKAAKIENFRFMDTLHHTATLQDHGWAWPGCIERVDASQRGSRAHWYTLPNNIRSRIGRAYRQGVERGDHPSRSWLEAHQAALEYARQKASTRQCLTRPGAIDTLEDNAIPESLV